MMRRIVVAILLLLLLASCKDEHPKYRSITPEERNLKDFTPEITITTTVGENMIQLKNLYVYPGFDLLEDLPSASRRSRWECKQSMIIDDVSYYRCSTDGSMLPSINMEAYSSAEYDLAIDRSGGVIGIVDKHDGSLTRNKNLIDGKLLPDVIGGKLHPVESITEGSYTQGLIKQELIYNGKSKDTIRISYREYIKDMARPAFYQDLTYDLLESREIAFRDIRIEVLEATNSTIKFIVKK